jgi:hypothetical protein
MQAQRCTQCGSNELENQGPDRLRCAYCGTVFQRPAKKGAEVHINPGAKVTLGPKAKVVVRGSLEIHGGAEVEIEGELTVVEPGDPELIRRAKAATRSNAKDL